MDMNLNICPTQSTINKIIEEFKITLQEDENIYTSEEFKKKLIERTYLLLLDDFVGEYVDSKKYLNVNDLNVGDKVCVEYMPYSQRYIPNYPPVNGMILFLDYEKRDGLIYTYDEYGKEMVQSIILPGCSYYGDSLGYDYFFHRW